MSKELRCDICDGRDAMWHVRKRWKIFSWFCSYDGDSWSREIDFCSACLDKFKEFVRTPNPKERKEDG